MNAAWREFAACAGANPELFSPDQPRAAAAATIRRFCVACPVMQACGDAATAGRDRGVWGGRYFTGTPARGLALVDLDRTVPEPHRATRGVCGSCGVVTALRGDGRIRRHDNPARAKCGGEGYLPLRRVA